VAAEVDGERVPPDPWFPLGRGDRVTLAPDRGSA
jgi:hypothetical protein